MDVFPHCFTIVTFAVATLAAAPVAADDGDWQMPEFDDVEQYRVHSEHGVVSADEPRASQIGAAILEKGGSAADAGIAAIFALGVTNPVGSGLGGGGFCLYRDADTAETTVLDFRETAPDDAHQKLYFFDGQAKPDRARHGGLAVATPGEPAGMWALHGRFGQLSWERVVDPAIELARDGFAVGSTLAGHLRSIEDDLADWPELKAVFTDDDGQLLGEGDELVRDELADALTILADEGVRPFYAGEVADAIVDTVQAHDGILTTDDLATYAIEPREPVVADFGDYQLQSMPPPSSGGIALVQALNILSHLDTDADVDDPAYVHLVVEALKHAFADRAHWLGDTDFVDVPTDKLLSDDYARTLAEQIDPDGVLDTYDYGTTPPDHEQAGTAHVSIIDADEHMLACTTTINTRLGSMVYVPEYGLILNNEMADFNVEPGEPNVFGLIGNEQNAVEGGKRPLSSMSPTLIVDDDKPVMSIGASGGPMIISGVYFSILDILVHELDPLDAITAPRLHHQWIPETLAVESDELEVADGLRRRGHELHLRRIFSAVQLVIGTDEGWTGVTDPRKGGIPAAPDSSNDNH